MNGLNPNIQDMGFLIRRPFFNYAALNWYEHVILGGEGGVGTLSHGRHAAVVDISQPPFWAWFLTLLYYFFNPGTMVQTECISCVWVSERLKRKGPVQILKGLCTGKFFPMSDKVHALFNNPPKVVGGSL